MKLFNAILVSTLFLLSTSLQSSSNQQLRYFAQAKLNTTDAVVLDDIEAAIQNNPNCFVVRLDRITNGLLIVTKEISSFTNDDLISWMEGNEAAIECSRIGVQGYDDHLPFDADFCTNAKQ